MAQPGPEDLTKILLPPQLQIIVDQYDPIAMGKLLSFTLDTQYPPISTYLTGLGTMLYPEFDPKQAPNALSAANRERCLVALLASRSRRLELAIHIYMALANGVEPAELAQIVVAVGAYTGVDTVANAFAVIQGTQEVLKSLATSKKAAPLAVLEALKKAFPS